MQGKVYDKRGIPIERGDIVKVFHFIGARRKRHYMYKQCLGVNTYQNSEQEYVFFSHLNFADLIGEEGGPYHEWLGTRLDHYEIVQSIKCDHEDSPRFAKDAAHD
jgi:hypothetical protein